MEKPKSKIAKSKSSNITITAERQKEQRSESGRKKSKSNAEFQTLMVKKRGVYVENKLSLDERATEPKAEELPTKPPPRPRPGSKRFLASVLTILSKSTTATQFPDNENETKVKAKKNNAKDPKSAPTNLKKKSKFRSKILKDGYYENDKFEVIQNKKEIVLTPSLYSEKSFVDDLKRRPVKSDLDDGWKARECKNIRENDDAVTGIVKEVIEGRMTKKKVKLDDAEPTTLVSEHKNDNLYNFFVDLLETTISVCNMKAQCDAAPIPSGKSSNIAFEIDESVVKKLNVGTEMLESTKPKQFHCVQNDDNWNTEKVTNWAPTILLPEIPKYPPKQRKTNSFAYIRRSVPPPPQSKSAVNTKKTSQKKNKKKNLLNILKEQLSVDIEEPQNLYEALRVMAKNKKKKEKIIRFDINFKNEGKCMLKPRKVISRRTKSSSKYERKSIPTEDPKKSDMFRRNLMIEQFSNHSLEVYDFDYDIRPKKRQKIEKPLLLTDHSSSSGSESFNEEFHTDSEPSLLAFNV